jgi:hypothetical protein
MPTWDVGPYTYLSVKVEKLFISCIGGYDICKPNLVHQRRVYRRSGSRVVEYVES